MFDPHVYISTIDLTEMDHSEDPSLPSDNLPDQISSTVSPTYILEALGAPIPPELLPPPVVEIPTPNFASTISWPTYPDKPFFNKYEPQPTDGLPVWPLHPEDCWDPVSGHPWPCCCRRCRDIPAHNPPPYVAPPSENSEEYNEEDYEIEVYTPTYYPEDTTNDGPDDDININTITTLTNVSLTPRCILDSGANRHIFNDESWLEGTSSLPLTPTSTPIHGISGSISSTKQCIIGNQAAFICPSAKDNVLALGWMTQFPTIVTTFSSLDNTFRISFGATTFSVPMASDSLYYITKDQVKQLLTHVNIVTLNNRVNLTTSFTKEQLARADEVRRIMRYYIHLIMS